MRFIYRMVKSKKQKGGHSPLAWTPADYKGVGDLAVAGDANYAKMPNVFPSNQVGGRKHKRSGSKRSGSKRSGSKRSYKRGYKRSQRGGMGYGFSNPADVPVVAGSYFPVTPSCTAKMDLSRGGNNFMSGGKGRSKTQKGGLILLGGKKNKTAKKSKIEKWWQKGCSKMKGGFFGM